MNLLSTVSKGKVQKPYYILVHGVPGIGKSTLASQFPNPLFLCAERGTSHLDVARLELTQFADFVATVKELREAKHDYKTIVIDTVDHLEALIHKVVAKSKGKDSIEDIGYNKGYEYALDLWRELVEPMEALRDERGMNIVFLAHTYVKTFNDPQLPVGYDRYQVKLHHKAASYLGDRVECVLFVNYETFVKVDDNNKARAFGEGARVMYTEHRPAFVAKNRFNLPFKLPLSFEDFDQAARSGDSKPPEVIKANIDEMIKQITDEKIKQKAAQKLSEIGSDPRQLVQLENKLKAILAA